MLNPSLSLKGKLREASHRAHKGAAMTLHSMPSMLSHLVGGLIGVARRSATLRRDEA